MALWFDLQNRHFSTVVVHHRESFVEWVKCLADHIGERIEFFYSPEESGIWLIPVYGSFSSGKHFDEYIAALKPEIIRREMGAYGPPPELTPKEWSAELCDKYLRLEFRHAQVDFGPV